MDSDSNQIIKPYFDLVFVVLVYRNVNVLHDFFESLQLVYSYRVIVVNSFYDQESERQCRVIADKHHADFLSVPNKGFGVGNNVGSQYAMDHYRYRYLVLSNSDILIHDLEYLRQLNYQRAVYAPDTRMENGHRQNPHIPIRFGFYMKLLNLSYRVKSEALMSVAFAINRLVREAYVAWTKLAGGREVRVFSAHGSFLILTYQASVELMPLFHEDMFLYNEELYLAHRCRQESIPVYYVPKLKITHLEGASSTPSSNSWKNHEDSYRVLSQWLQVPPSPYISFLRYTIAQKCVPKDLLEKIDWKKLMQFAVKQSLVGVIYEGVKTCKSRYADSIGKKDLLSWYLTSEKSRKSYAIVGQRISELTKMLNDAGFKSCILKGQGVALMYPVVESRSVGDIDVWIDGSRKDITLFVHSKFPKAFEQYHHIDFPVFKDITVEIHYLPSQMSCPLHQARLQRYYRKHQQEQFGNLCPALGENVSVPTKQFNAIFLLSHMMRHFFNEGIGLRQLVDYYYLMKQGFAGSEKKEYADTVDYLGMKKFAGAVMWIETTILGLSPEFLLTAPHEKAGIFLYHEILETGNFGVYDTRYTFRKKGFWATALTDIYRDFLLARMFPSEALWKFYAKVVNQKWKIKHLLRRYC